MTSIEGDALRQATVTELATFGEAVAAFDRAGRGMALVCDAAGAPRAILTDDEIRAAWLRGLAPSDPVLLAASSLEAAAGEVAVERDAAGRPSRVTLRSTADDGRPLRALVLAGGLGTRMRPLTEELPKPLVPIGGRPMIDRVLEHLARNGVTDVTLATHYLADRVEKHVGDGARFGLRVRVVREEKRLGTAGAIGLLDPRPTEPFLVANGDVLTGLDLRAMARRHRRSDAAMTMAVHPYGVEVPYGIARIVGSRVVQLTEKPRFVHWANAGIYVVSPSVVATVEPRTYVDMTTLIDRLIARGEPVEAFPIREYWRDAGTPGDLERANRELGSP
ncbi:MAG TPA: nucleotidyltransferase family protein [Planctomycetota bacterium]|nr:nucleotidyltransferase family protein [Planctomycetota bacterium]